MEKQLFIARQGDVLVKEISTLPSGAVKIKSSVVAVGEGHHEHKVIGQVDVLELDEKLYLSVDANGQLVHVHTGTDNMAEHNPIDLPTGTYEIIHQRQYNPYEKVIERVRD